VVCQFLKLQQSGFLPLRTGLRLGRSLPAANFEKFWRSSIIQQIVVSKNSNQCTQEDRSVKENYDDSRTDSGIDLQWSPFADWWLWRVIRGNVGRRRAGE
jgi:hypothetical protein